MGYMLLESVSGKIENFQLKIFQLHDLSNYTFQLHVSLAYAFCQYDEIFINQYSELVSYSDAVKKCGLRGGLAWPHALKLRKGDRPI